MKEFVVRHFYLILTTKLLTNETLQIPSVIGRESFVKILSFLLSI